MDHAHQNSKGNANDILAEKISRQEQVLATIPKAETKKRKNTKKEEGKVKKSRNSDPKRPLTHQKYREMQEDDFQIKEI